MEWEEWRNNGGLRGWNNGMVGWWEVETLEQWNGGILEWWELRTAWPVTDLIITPLFQSNNLYAAPER
jgi:hypothetical protein